MTWDNGIRTRARAWIDGFRNRYFKPLPGVDCRRQKCAIFSKGKRGDCMDSLLKCTIRLAFVWHVPLPNASVLSDSAEISSWYCHLTGFDLSHERLRSKVSLLYMFVLMRETDVVGGFISQVNDSLPLLNWKGASRNFQHFCLKHGLRQGPNRLNCTRCCFAMTSLI